MVLGLTGHIASGKSTVARAFARLGAVIIDADQLAREVVQPGSRVLAAIVRRFGEEVLMSDGVLDRSALGSVVFSDPTALSDLNHLTHPAIRDLACRRLIEAQQLNAPLIVYDAALLYEVGADQLVDKVLLVMVDKNVQLHRLMARNGLNREEALQRISAQSGLVEKMKKADYVIDNSGSEEELAARIADIWRELTGAED